MDDNFAVQRRKPLPHSSRLRLSRTRRHGNLNKSLFRTTGIKGSLKKPGDLVSAEKGAGKKRAWDDMIFDNNRQHDAKEQRIPENTKRRTIVDLEVCQQTSILGIHESPLMDHAKDTHIADDVDEDDGAAIGYHHECSHAAPISSQNGTSKEQLTTEKSRNAPSSQIGEGLAETLISPSKPERGSKGISLTKVARISDSDDDDFDAPLNFASPFENLVIRKVRRPRMRARCALDFSGEEKTSQAPSNVRKRGRSPPQVLNLEEEGPLFYSQEELSQAVQDEIRTIPSPPSTSQDDDVSEGQQEHLRKVGAEASSTSQRTSSMRKGKGMQQKFWSVRRFFERRPTSSTRYSQISTPPASKKVYHLRSFEYVMNATLSRHRDILSDDDIKYAEKFKSLSENAQRLFVRLYRRKLLKWFRFDSLERSYMEEIDITSAIKELSTTEIVTVARDLASKTYDEHTKRTVAREIVSALTPQELRDAAKSQWDGDRLRKMKRTTLELEFKERLKTSQTAETGNPARGRQRTIDGSSSELLLAKAILKIAHDCIRLRYRYIAAFRRIHFLFFLEDGAESPRVLLAYAGRTKFADYHVPHSPVTPVFRSRLSLQAYEYARSLELKLGAAEETGREEDVIKFGDIAENELRKFYFSYKIRPTSQKHASSRSDVDAEASSPQRFDLVSRGSIHTSVADSNKWSSAECARHRLETRKQLQHPFLRRYTSVWVYGRTAWHSVASLEKRKEYHKAVARLKLLLKTGLCSLRRGKWINRLTVDLERHLKEPVEAYSVCLQTLKNSSREIHIGDRIALAKRARKLYRAIHQNTAEEICKPKAKTKKGLKTLVQDYLEKTLDPAIKQQLENLGKLPQRTILGKALPRSERNEDSTRKSAKRSPWVRHEGDVTHSDEEASPGGNPAGMKSTFASFTNKTLGVTVEDLALEVYISEGWKGTHCEGAAIRFLFALFMWDLLFMDVDDVFQTPFQDSPLDLQTEAFYISRKGPIKKRLEMIKGMTPEKMKEWIETCYTKNSNTTVKGGQWDRFSLDDSIALAVCIGGRAMEKICFLLATDYGYWSGGFPDLVLWKPADKGQRLGGQAKFVEVKSARDSLAERQSAWVRELLDAGADVEVCKVVEKVTPRNKTAVKNGEGDIDGEGINRIEQEYEYISLDA